MKKGRILCGGSAGRLRLRRRSRSAWATASLGASLAPHSEVAREHYCNEPAHADKSCFAKRRRREIFIAPVHEMSFHSPFMGAMWISLLKELRIYLLAAVL